MKPSNFTPLQRQLWAKLQQAPLMHSDFRRLSAEIRRLGKKTALESNHIGTSPLASQPSQNQALTAQKQRLQEIEQAIAQAQARLAQRKSLTPNVSYPDLPVSQRREEILAAIKQHQVVVIAGETGSGKTTQLPKMCLELGLGLKGMIGHTQPRRIAARSVASRIAQELQTELGASVGYKVRFSDKISEQTQIKLMTDGILLSEIQQDHFLNQYDCLIIDEAHERSLNNDFILGYLKQLLPRRPDLKLIITSATIDVERFSRHFDNAPIIEVSGRAYPVEVRYRPLEDLPEQDQLQGILTAVEELSGEKAGDILIFLSGEREIRDTAEALEKEKQKQGSRLKFCEILPLFARLSAQEQNRIFQPTNLNRIVLATNVAETSLTIPNIKYVIDTGLARISRYSYRTKVQRLPIEPISQASANQRKGRCGRVAEGICIRLYSEQDFLNRPEFTDPEILRTNLASVILQMTALGFEDIESFPFVDAPDKRHIQDGIRLLEELEAIKTVKQRRQLTAIGRQLAQLSVDPRLAKMLLTGAKLGCLYELMVIVSALSIQDPRERPQEKQQAADDKHRRFADKKSDFLAFLNLWKYLQQKQKQESKNQFRRLCQKDYLNYLRIREWQDIYQQIRLTVREMGLAINSSEAKYEQIHTALLSGLLSHIGLKEAEKNQYLGARNAHFAIFPNSVLFKAQPKWLMAGELLETSKLWGRMLAQIEPEWIEPMAQHLIKKSYAEPHWSKSQGAVLAQEKVTLYGVPIVAKRLVNYSKIDPKTCREIFIQVALVEGNWHTKHKFFRQNQKLIEQIEQLEHKSRRRDILVDEQTLFAFYDQRIGQEVVSQAHFDRWWQKAEREQPDLLNFEKSFLTKDNSRTVSELDFPNFWYQGDLKLKLSYQFEPGTEADGVTLHIPLPVLNQVENQGFDWQIPGLRQELIMALIKSLPKALRRNFVPAPNYAAAFLERTRQTDKPLLESLSQQFRQMTGVSVALEQWNWQQLPHHLKMNFRVIDQKGRKIAESTDLDLLKYQLKPQIQQSIAAIADKAIEQSGCASWSFGQLPQFYEQKQRGFALKAYPAIVDEGGSVGIKLFETEYEQAHAMQQGLRRLLLLNVPSPIKYLHEKLPNKAKLGLYFTPFGSVLNLIDDCIAAAVDKLMADFGGLVWNEQDFNQLKEQVRANLNPATIAIAQQVEQILTAHFALNKRLKGKLDFNLAFAFADIKQQLAGLIFPNFVQATGSHRLGDLLRYLAAVDKRLDKLAQDLNRDRAAMLRVEQVQQAYQALLAKLPKAKPRRAEVSQIPEMIEELRVSLFAQQLGTKYPISDKRILNHIAEIGSGKA